MKKCIVLSLLVILMCACSSHTQEETSKEDAKVVDSLYVIEKDYLVSPDTIKLTDIADSLIYISLEKNKECEINSIRKVKLGDDFILVQNGLTQLFKFDLNGHYLGQIAKEAYSSGLYSYIAGFDYCKNNGLIYIASKNKILCYNSNNKHILTIELEHEMRDFGNIISVINSNSIAISQSNIGDNKDQLVIIDTLGVVQKAYKNTNPFMSDNTPLTMSTSFFNTLYRFNDQIIYHPMYGDTAFLIKSDTLIPYIIEKKVPKIPLEYQLCYTGNQKETRQYSLKNRHYSTRIDESSRYIQITGLRGTNFSIKGRFYWLYDKKTKVLKTNRPIVKDGTVWLGYFNDWNGGLCDVNEQIDGDFIISWRESSKFKRNNTEDVIVSGRKLRLKTSQCRSPERKKQLDDFLEKLDKNANPVLTLIQLKK